jgi:hypothetical protein
MHATKNPLDNLRGYAEYNRVVMDHPKFTITNCVMNNHLLVWMNESVEYTFIPAETGYCWSMRSRANKWKRAIMTPENTTELSAILFALNRRHLRFEISILFTDVNPIRSSGHIDIDDFRYYAIEFVSASPFPIIRISDKMELKWQGQPITGAWLAHCLTPIKVKRIQVRNEITTIELTEAAGFITIKPIEKVLEGLEGKDLQNAEYTINRNGYKYEVAHDDSRGVAYSYSRFVSTQTEAIQWVANRISNHAHTVPYDYRPNPLPEWVASIP